jgi:hypothetical protein
MRLLRPLHWTKNTLLFAAVSLWTVLAVVPIYGR